MYLLVLVEVTALLRNNHLELSKLQTCKTRIVEASGDLLHSSYPAKWIAFIHQGAHAPKGQTGRISVSRSSEFRDTYEFFSSNKKKKEKEKKTPVCTE